MSCRVWPSGSAELIEEPSRKQVDRTSNLELAFQDPAQMFTEDEMTCKI